VTAVSDELAVLREEFPAYRIWREETPGRSRYVARSRHQGLSPHTIVTAEIGELREALEPAGHLAATPQARFSPAEPNVARMYGYWLHEKDHYATDRAAADAITEQFPEVAAIARANRAFLGRAVRFAARQGIKQFVDLGSGLPASPNVHEIAQSIDPDTRVVYVDHDPIVLAHARALLAADGNVSVGCGRHPRPGRVVTR
jgi:S-adenosyl methyltransferase